MIYTALQKQAGTQIRSFGTKFVLSRTGAEVAKDTGVFVNASNNDMDSSSGSAVSGAVSAQRVVLIPGSIKVAPKVGDVISSKQGTFSVLEVEVVQPADIPILYKAVVSK